MDEQSNLPVIDVTRATDISEDNMKKVQAFIQEGLPGIGTVKEDTVAKMTDLYLAGKTYIQISQICRTDKTMVMYLSYKLNWATIRKEYMIELEDQMKRRVIEARLMSQDFLLQLSQMWQKKIGHKITRYLATDNEEFTDQINLKELDRYLKTIELLQKSMAEPREGKGPLVGINVGEGATITRKGDNEIEVTPKQKAIGDVLKHYADLRREEDNKK